MLNQLAKLIWGADAVVKSKPEDPRTASEVKSQISVSGKLATEAVIIISGFIGPASRMAA
jgi:hypothetical protein